MENHKKYSSPINYAWAEHKSPMLFGLFIFILIIGCSLYSNSDEDRDSFYDWVNWLEAAFGVITFFVAIGIWWLQINRDWREALPKKMTVEFYLKSSSKPPLLLMKCEKAQLMGEGDIRAWAQQVGSQMANKAQLDFDVYSIRIINKEPFPEPNTKLEDRPWYFHYTVRIDLEKMPVASEKVGDKMVPKAVEFDGKKLEDQFIDGKYLRWTPGNNNTAEKSWVNRT